MVTYHFPYPLGMAAASALLIPFASGTWHDVAAWNAIGLGLLAAGAAFHDLRILRRARYRGGPA